ncbi:MAG: hypothetical protein JW850_11055 [Thermoflexales bacterium]|nr:hypothetical protein [Thermoflexales bacterium]
MKSQSEHPIAELATYRELMSAEQQTVQAHLAACAACRAQFEAFQCQDRLLSALPELAPRLSQRAAAAPRVSGVWAGLARLGDVMAVGGVAAVTIAAVLLVHVMATTPMQTGSAPPLPVLPSTPPPSVSFPNVQVNAWVLAAPWLGGAASLVGLLLALGRRRRLWAILGLALAAFLLLSFVPPLSALPNPAGLFWRVAGGYSYNPNLPFRNLFVMSGDPTEEIAPYLDDLIGQVGLDPLDPTQALARYAFERVSLLNDHRTVLVRTRFTYADGSSRVYAMPLSDPYADTFGLRLWGWQNDGLARLRTEHLALPGQPFATDDAPACLGEAARLSLSPKADQLDGANPAHWLWSSNRLQRMVWSPRGDAFLLVEQKPDLAYQLWLVTLDGSDPQPVNRSGSVYEYGWSLPDGSYILYTAPGELPSFYSTRSEGIQLVVVSRDALERPALQRAIPNTSLPSLTRQGAWYAQEGALWVMDYQSGESIRVADLPGLGPALGALAVSPDAARVAYACDTDLCLMELDGGALHTIPAAGVRSIVWDAAGERLAAISLDRNNLGPVCLFILSRQAELLHEVDIAPREASDPPQWTPDGKLVLVQTFPMGGRRIIAADADTGQVLDLSREHWDAYFALSPDGQSVLLNNGRGGFWLSPLLR